MSREIFLQEDSLITSKTDLKGKIVYANDDFLKYAGYTMGEVLNKPHNIVRHEEMPKTVFKYLMGLYERRQRNFCLRKK